MPPITSINNGNGVQKFTIQSLSPEVVHLKILFTESFDFYNRIIIYSLVLKGACEF